MLRLDHVIYVPIHDYSSNIDILQQKLLRLRRFFAMKWVEKYQFSNRKLMPLWLLVMLQIDLLNLVVLTYKSVWIDGFAAISTVLHSCSFCRCHCEFQLTIAAKIERINWTHIEWMTNEFGFLMDYYAL